MTHPLPPIVRLSERLLVDIEQAVRTFPRYTKYTVGTDLRRLAMKVSTMAHRAWMERKQANQWRQQLVWAIDELKIALQLGKRIHAFRSFAQFEAIATLAHDLGRQAGGWLRQESPDGQNPARANGQERAKTLSTRAASHEANP